MTEVAKYIIDLTDDGDVSLDVVEDGTGLTKRERVIVQKTWDQVCSIGRANVGIVMWNLFFDRHPEYTTLFKAFNDLSREELRTHAKLKAHGINVIQALTGVIDNLEDGETAVLVLEKTGRDHVRRKIKAQHFHDFEKTTLVLMEKQLGPNWTPIVEQSWIKAVGVIMSVTLDALKKQEDILASAN